MPEWSFENIAIFDVNNPSRRASGGCRGSSRRSDRIFEKPRKSTFSNETFTQTVDTGFQSFEWDTLVILVSPDARSMDFSVQSVLSEMFAF